MVHQWMIDKRKEYLVSLISSQVMLKGMAEQLDRDPYLGISFATRGAIQDDLAHLSIAINKAVQDIATMTLALPAAPSEPNGGREQE